MKGALLFLALKTIGEMGVKASDLAEVIISAPYGTNIQGFERRLSLKSAQRDNAIISNRRYSEMIYRLRKNNLIKPPEKDGVFFYKLTDAGKNKLARFRSAPPLPNVRFRETRKFGNLVLITFDVPEKESRKRKWLRGMIKDMGFTMLQKSVWIGRTSIPRNFMEAVREAQMLDYVEILEITKSGTIKYVS